MSNRNFPNFLEAYVEYAHDGFCPNEFHTWTGIAIIAAALERKCWLKQGDVVHHPNIFTLLVSHPSAGKSTALQKGVDLLEDLKDRYNPNFKILPNQTTEASLVKMMNTFQEITVGQQKFQHSSGFFFASEASSSALKNEHGDFNATLTAFYDCPKKFRKQLASEKVMTELPNVCFNVLAGTTFNFLKTLVNEVNVMGGLASRFIYVVSKEKKEREGKFDSYSKKDPSTAWKLTEDLWSINRMTGIFRPTEGYIKAWEASQSAYSKYIIGLDSPRIESIMSRKFTNTTKLSMILCASEGPDMILTEAQWTLACQMMDEVTKDNAFIVNSAIMENKSSQAGLTQTILSTIKKLGGECDLSIVKQAILKGGNDLMRVDNTIKMIISANQMEYVDGSNMTRVRALVDSDANL